MQGQNLELIHKVANSIREGYGPWKNSLCDLHKPASTHFVSGLVRNTMDTVLCKAIQTRVKPELQPALTHLAKTAALGAQISVLAPGAFTLNMAAIIGVGGAISPTVRSLARLLGQVLLIKCLVSIAQGNRVALLSLLFSVAGAYAGTALGQCINQQIRQHTNLHLHSPLPHHANQQPKVQATPPNLASALLNVVQSIDQSASNTIDTYIHLNYLIKKMFPAVDLSRAQPALSARVMT